ncbi:MAG: hypothetical protein M1142_03430 [Patescibacteria group bacterium]|nr:hypothetical protein [Patescibacteria group bacterium]
MKKFIVGFILGTIIMIIAGQFWGLMPTLPNPITSNPFTLWCDQLNSHTSGFGKVEVTITQNSQPVSDLTVNLSVKKPPIANYPGAKPGEFVVPEKACFVGTNNKGVGMFTKVPIGTAYIFFNNDPAAYPKRFGQPNFSITSIEVKNNETSTVTIDLNPKD